EKPPQRAEKPVRSLPSHPGQAVSAESENDCTASNWCPHSGSVQAYWYLGTPTSCWHSHHPTANRLAEIHPAEEGGDRRCYRPVMRLDRQVGLDELGVVEQHGYGEVGQTCQRSVVVAGTTAQAGASPVHRQ